VQRLRLRRPIAGILDELLERADLPQDTRVHIHETSVVQPSCRSEEEAARAMTALLYELSADPRVVRVFPFSPWPPGQRNDGHAYRNYLIRPGTPIGDAVAAWAAAPRVPPGSGR
jgi:hypothetical protein